MNKITLHIAAYTDYDQDGNCDRKPEILGVFKTEEEANAAVEKDILETIANNPAYEDCDKDEALVELSVHDEDFLNGCEWSIIEQEVELDEAE